MNAATARQNPGGGELVSMSARDLVALLRSVAAERPERTDDAAALATLAEAFRAGAMVVLPEDLIGPKEAAALIGVDRTTVSRWKSSGYMPRPFAEPAIGPLWLRPVVEAFAERHRRTADAAGRRPLGSAAAT
jgi:hypothetical protein